MKNTHKRCPFTIIRRQSIANKKTEDATDLLGQLGPKPSQQARPDEVRVGSTDLRRRAAGANAKWNYTEQHWWCLKKLSTLTTLA